MPHIVNHTLYLDTLTLLKEEIRQARIRAHVSVNKELILLYWKIGQEIIKRKEELGWGAKIIQQLSKDLRYEFPEMKGLSDRNLIYMQTFAAAYPDIKITQALPAQISWYHNQTILDKIKDPDQRIWYIQKTIENGWSRNALVLQIENSLYERQGKSLTNFKNTLPSSTSDLVQTLFKSEYNLEFLCLEETAQERQIEKNITNHIRAFLLELGTGFAFMGNQYRLNVGGDDFYIDMLFYHTKLHCYIVVELKSGKFEPSYLGQLEFYLTAVDEKLKQPTDQTTIGLLLCKEANNLVVEYALKTKNQPMGVSKYTLSKNALPVELENNIPSPQEFAHLLETIEDKGKQ
jgi:predicted nuclease of restriction endonuclease-like (RecB) superfamily